MSLDGFSLLNMPPQNVPDAGIAMVHEGRGIFGELTVDENLMLGAHPKRARGGEAMRFDLVFDLFPKLAARRKQTARTMSGGEQQMVDIGRALMNNPRLLMLYEPSLGLAPIVVTELLAVLRRIRETGVALLLVE